MIEQKTDAESQRRTDGRPSAEGVGSSVQHACAFTHERTNERTDGRTDGRTNGHYAEQSCSHSFSRIYIYICRSLGTPPAFVLESKSQASLAVMARNARRNLTAMPLMQKGTEGWRRRWRRNQVMAATRMRWLRRSRARGRWRRNKTVIGRCETTAPVREMGIRWVVGRSAPVAKDFSSDKKFSLLNIL